MCAASTCGNLSRIHLTKNLRSNQNSNQIIHVSSKPNFFVGTVVKNKLRWYPQQPQRSIFPNLSEALQSHSWVSMNYIYIIYIYIYI